jgi:MoaA/NifB/PqqE/SkfB family radical SAM enzyme
MKEILKRYKANLSIDDFENPTPSTLNVEVNNICNLKCVMCPTSTSIRKKGMMDLELFRNVLDEAVEMGITQVALHTVGEPILHPQIAEFIRLSKSKNVYTYMDVNGNYFRDGLHGEIIDAGLDSLKFSIDGHNQETYSKIRCGGNLEKVMENLKLMHELRKQKKSGMKLFAQFMICSLNQAHINDFKKKISPFVDEIQISVVLNQGGQLSNFDDLPSEKLNSVIQKHRKRCVCRSPFKRIIISWDGYLTACCIDFELDLKYAKYEKGKLKELWNCDNLRDIRRKIVSSDLESLKICKSCDRIYYDVPALMEEVNEIY